MKFVLWTFSFIILLFIPYLILVRNQEKKSFIPVKIIQNKPLIYCIILTTAKNLPNKAKVIFDSWASKCDNYTFVSKLPRSDSKIHSIKNSHERLEIKYRNLFNVLKPKDFTLDRYAALTTKVLTSFMDVYKHHPHYDWYLKADDDTFLFVDNLRNFVSEKNSNNPVTYGFNFEKYVDGGYHSGGAGYLLSHGALNTLTEKLYSNKSYCVNQGIEDIDVAQCLRDLNVYPQNSTDELNRERFHPLSLTDHFNGNFPDWLKTYSQNKPKKV